MLSSWLLFSTPSLLSDAWDAPLSLSPGQRVDAPWTGVLEPMPAAPLRAGMPSAHVDSALQYVGLRERAGNRHPLIDRWLAHVGLDGGYAWCAAFVSSMLDAAGATAPTIRDARSRLFVLPTSATRADVEAGRQLPRGTLTIHRYTRWTGHIGILTRHEGRGRGSVLHTVEGNTSNPHGPGEGVYEKRRPLLGSNYLAPVAFTAVSYDGTTGPKNLRLQ